MTMEIRGGQWKIRRITTTTSVDSFQPPNAPTKFMQVANEGANVVHLFDNATDATADTNYIALGAAGSGSEYWEGPLELADNNDKLWFRSLIGASTLAVISYQRRG